MRGIIYVLLIILFFLSSCLLDDNYYDYYTERSYIQECAWIDSNSLLCCDIYDYEYDCVLWAYLYRIDLKTNFKTILYDYEGYIHSLRVDNDKVYVKMNNELHVFDLNSFSDQRLYQSSSSIQVDDNILEMYYTDDDSLFYKDLVTGRDSLLDDSITSIIYVDWPSHSLITYYDDLIMQRFPNGESFILIDLNDEEYRYYKVSPSYFNYTFQTSDSNIVIIRLASYDEEYTDIMIDISDSVFVFEGTISEREFIHNSQDCYIVQYRDSINIYNAADSMISQFKYSYGNLYAD